jgi:anti-sigma B factor antagonist
MGDPMSDSQESIVVASRREGPKAIVELSGELDLHSSPQLSATVDDLLADSPSVVEIDAAGLTFADSAGLRALLVAHSDAGQRGVTLRLSRVSEQLDRLLEMTGLRETLVGVA